MKKKIDGFNGPNHAGCWIHLCGVPILLVWRPYPWLLTGKKRKIFKKRSNRCFGFYKKLYLGTIKIRESVFSPGLQAFFAQARFFFGNGTMWALFQKRQTPPFIVLANIFAFSYLSLKLGFKFSEMRYIWAVQKRTKPEQRLCSYSEPFSSHC